MYGRSEASPDSEQIERNARMCKKRNSVSMEQIQDRVKERERKFGFTLAEVLITLAIIGIVAALTMPTLIEKHQKAVVETRLKHFYSVVNNALRMAAGDNGDVEDCLPARKNNTYEETLTYLQEYIFPYIKYTKYSKCSTNCPYCVCVYLTDGSMFMTYVNLDGMDFLYFINSKEIKTTKNYFVFQLNKKNLVNTVPADFIEPYIFSWNGQMSTLKSHSRFGCRKSNPDSAFCTKIIQLNGWKIPDDYPW